MTKLEGIIHTLDETMKLTNVNSSHDLETNMGIHATSPVIHPTNLAEDHEKTTNNKYIPRSDKTIWCSENHAINIYLYAFRSKFTQKLLRNCPVWLS